MRELGKTGSLMYAQDPLCPAPNPLSLDAPTITIPAGSTFLGVLDT